MSEFVDENEEVADQKISGDDSTEANIVAAAPIMIDFAQPQQVLYCPTCTMPPEFCEFGASFDKCLPWIMENCQECLSEALLAELLGKASLEDGEEVRLDFFRLYDPLITRYLCVGW